MHATTQIGCTLLFLGLCVSVAPGDYDLTWFTIDGGGAGAFDASTGDDYELSGTIGQLDAGVMVGDDYELTGGFWFRVVPADCNADGTVDLFDYGDFEPCLVGPDVVPGDPDCDCFDLDLDGDVDLHDFSDFQVAFVGS